LDRGQGSKAVVEKKQADQQLHNTKEIDLFKIHTRERRRLITIVKITNGTITKASALYIITESGAYITE